MGLLAKLRWRFRRAIRFHIPADDELCMLCGHPGLDHVHLAGPGHWLSCHNKAHEDLDDEDGCLVNLDWVRLF